MRIDEELNIPSIKSYLESCCHSEVNCGSCVGKQCLVGFAKIISDYAAIKKTLTIPNGIKMVPFQDFKVYETNNVAMALAAINLECKNCMDNHDDNCVVNIIRSSLEVALLGQYVDFSGNPLSYLMSLIQRNDEVGKQVMAHYNEFKINRQSA